MFAHAQIFNGQTAIGTKHAAIGFSDARMHRDPGVIF
jgi:hypothetical protein